MEPPLRYVPGLEDLLYLTSETEFRRHIGWRSELVVLLALKQIDCVAPVMSVQERETLLLSLIDNPIVPYIPAFNVFNFQLDLPDGIYEELRDIGVDENNLTRILTMIREGMVPGLHRLLMMTPRPIRISTTHLEHLRSLTLKNTTDDIYALPSLGGLSLDTLDLTGYAMEFRGSLPSVLALQRCFVKNSRDIRGCKEMKLISTVWEASPSPGSMPSDILVIEGGVLTAQLPDTLVSLTMVNTEMEVPMPGGLLSLHYDNRLADARNSADVDLEGLRLETLIVTLYTDRYFIPQTVKKLFVMGVVPSVLHSGLVSLELNNAVVDQVQLNEGLPPTLGSIRLLECSFASSGDIDLPSTLRNIEFISCSDERQVGIEAGDGMETLLVIGQMPKIRTGRLSEGSVTRYLQAKTNTLLMNMREFHLFCISQMGKPSFASFEDCYTDILSGIRWKTREELLEYTNLMFKYPFRIPNIHSPFIAKNVVMMANPASSIRIGNAYHKVAALRRFVSSRTPLPSQDRKLSSFIEDLRRADDLL